ncbi:protein TIFY 9-like isoform X1 [Pistacia vera]|uniref:protein TIFY 9 isoform X1 n=1 Tax=Pistacia vera TaxID=55513 RepID=UPI001262BB21|nr:protein TIFY 9 isoform X1 [Pistacia vera]XP_031279463.1 protein TIFY 9-like isoform X1 [Pistacia vera]
MSRATVELDFFGMERKEMASSKSQFQKFLHRQRSFRDLQGAISKINPEILKSVIASGSVNTVDSKKLPVSMPTTPKEEPASFPALPLFKHISVSRSATENLPETAPLTIFYNGTVTVYDVPRDKAECILKLAVDGNSKTEESKNSKTATDQQQLLETLNTGDLPIARKKSLQRFLEKRRERNDMDSDPNQRSG